MKSSFFGKAKVIAVLLVGLVGAPACKSRNDAESGLRENRSGAVNDLTGLPSAIDGTNAPFGKIPGLIVGAKTGRFGLSNDSKDLITSVSQKLIDRIVASGTPGQNEAFLLVMFDISLTFGTNAYKISSIKDAYNQALIDGSTYLDQLADSNPNAKPFVDYYKVKGLKGLFKFVVDGDQKYSKRFKLLQGGEILEAVVVGQDCSIASVVAVQDDNSIPPLLDALTASWGAAN